MTWKTERKDCVDMANLQVNAIADNIFKPDPVRPRRSYITDAAYGPIRLRRGVTRATRACAADSTSQRALAATVKLAYQLAEATLPTITAAGSLKDTSTLTTMVDAAIKLVHYLAPAEEIQVAARAFLRHAEPQLTLAMRNDKAEMLNRHADSLTECINANATRQ